MQFVLNMILKELVSLGCCVAVDHIWVMDAKECQISQYWAHQNRGGNYSNDF